MSTVLDETAIKPGPASTTPRKVRRRRPGRGRLYAIALVVCAIYLVPMLYVVGVSLGGNTASGGNLFADGLHPENFIKAFQSTDFALYFANSALVTIVSAACQVFLSCMAGYALARIKFRGRGLVLGGLIALLVVPPEVIMVPLFIIMTKFPLLGGNDIFGAGGGGLLNTYFGLMVPHLASALGVFLMRQFYIDLPDELGQAARIDGAGEYRIFLQIYTPLAFPAVAVVAVLAFQGAWNDFLWPLIMTRSNDMQTLQLGLTVFFQQDSTQWNLLMAAVLIISIPVVALFLFGQRYFQSGILAGADK
ncbi:carbohydrate ABC transporter permease [Arthrobacter sp.]|uniref:carbohydrate ABC transporter permease n=1 Tax=Arthrobacter sp. TaxID=1667 RepID=UPI0026DFBFBF|nr:carbohydrate ABC transporter permease [Arthrobacter sp.]MDO5753601.1 carbohydrate ABC transporter permease [Arthrobacter sp.]